MQMPESIPNIHLIQRKLNHPIRHLSAGALSHSGHPHPGRFAPIGDRGGQSSGALLSFRFSRANQNPERLPEGLGFGRGERVRERRLSETG